MGSEFSVDWSEGKCHRETMVMLNKLVVPPPTRVCMILSHRHGFVESVMSRSTYNMNLKQQTEQETDDCSLPGCWPDNSLNAGNEAHISSMAFSDQWRTVNLLNTSVSMSFVTCWKKKQQLDVLDMIGRVEKDCIKKDADETCTSFKKRSRHGLSAKMWQL